VLSVKAPGAVTFDDDEIEEVNTAQLALLLHKTPDEIRQMNPRDAAVVLQVHAANEEIKAHYAQQSRKKR
jgi:hypothetical protein